MVASATLGPGIYMSEAIAETPIVWPDQARCAALVSVNFDAELFWMRLDPSTAKRPKTRSIGEYGVHRGADRVLEVLANHDVRASWFVPAAIADRHPDVIERVLARGHEICCRGFSAEQFHRLPRGDQEKTLAGALEVLTRVCGQRPVGFRTPDDLTGETFAILQDLGITWSSCMRGDDRPVFVGRGPREERILDIPYHWECQDAPAFLFNYSPAYPPGQCRIASYTTVLADWISEFDAYRARALCFVLTVDPQVIGRPGRIGLLDQLLEHIRREGDVWLATGVEVADHWRKSGLDNDPGESELIRAAVERAQSNQ